jgi:hypothetical protein
MSQGARCRRLGVVGAAACLSGNSLRSAQLSLQPWSVQLAVPWLLAEMQELVSHPGPVSLTGCASQLRLV